MNEIQLLILGLIILGASLVLFSLTDIIPTVIEDKEMDIIISLGIGLLILVVGKRQDRHLNEITQTQHKLTFEIHKMMIEQTKIIKEMHTDNKG